MPPSDRERFLMTAERNTRIITGIFFLLVLLFAVPVSASTVTIDNSSSIAAALLCVGDSGTLILEPGIYFQNSITLSNSTTIKANTSGGHGAADTIIDAQGSGRIFIADSYSYSLSIESLTLRNGRGGYGGAIVTIGPVTVTNSTFESCTATSDDGGVIHSHNTVTVTNSTFTHCTATIDGGAIYSSGTVTVTSSVFESCTTPIASYCTGGAIYSGSGTVMVINSSTFESCKAGDGGAIYSGGNITVTNSTLTSCTARDGGAIFSSGTFTVINSSTFNSCTATTSYGGAIHTQSSSSSSFTVTNSMFDSCTAKVRGGAINSYSTSVTVTNSTFDNCTSTAGNAGGIYSDGGVTVINSSTFNICTAKGGNGGAIDLIGGTIEVTNSTLTGCTAYNGNAINSSGTGEMHFSRIYNCSSSGKTVNSTGTFNATNNWWGTNNPSSGFNSSNVFVEPWLVLGAIVDPSSITPAGTSTVRANLTWNSAGTDTSGIGHVPDGIPLSFDIARGSGNLSVTNGYLISGINESIFTPDGLGTTNLSATLDDQTVNVSLIVSPVPSASFTGSPTSGTVPLVVSFTDTSTGSPTCWNWSFGDGEWFNTTNPGLKNATHTYLSAGTYTVNLTVSNGLGNDTESLAGYITVNPASSSGGSSSRSGSGGSNFDTGTGFATDIKAGETVSFDLDKGAVYIVSITAGTDIKKLMITVQRKLSVPSSVGNPGTNVYEYENAELYYADNSELSGGTFNFKVEKSWMTANGYDYTDIVMLHYNEETGEWENLPTTFLSEDGNYYYYSAETPSFSWFAIAVSEDSAAVSGSSESTKAATAVSTSSSSNVPAESTAATDNPGGTEEQQAGMPVVIPVLFVVIAIIAIAAIAPRRKKEE